VLGFYDVLISGAGPHLDVRWARHEWGNSTVGSIGPSSAVWSSVYLNVRDFQVLRIQLFGLRKKIKHRLLKKETTLALESMFSTSPLMSLIDLVGHLPIRFF
jgi:hypothetical protein